MMTHLTRIFVAGGETLLGKALLGRLEAKKDWRLVGTPPHEPNLTSRDQTEHFFAACRPEIVIMAAGLSGGIDANQNAPADLMLDNLLVSAHVLAASSGHRVKKLLYLGSSCMYPRHARQPMQPGMLETGPLETTSAAYATAKLAGVRLCQAYRRQHGDAFIAAIAANTFGPHDDFSIHTSHVIPGLMRRMHEAKQRGTSELRIWGTGKPRRDFIYAPDLADACIRVLDHYDGEEPINLGSGSDTSIAEVATLIAQVVGYRGKLAFDASKPDGAARKCLDSSKLFTLGWRPATSLRTALEHTYAWYMRRENQLTKEAAHHVRAAI
jgi:GDP-L-fucose synthase